MPTYEERNQADAENFLVNPDEHGRKHINRGNFANDPDRARTAGRLGGKSKGGFGSRSRRRA